MSAMGAAECQGLMQTECQKQAEGPPAISEACIEDLEAMCASADDLPDSCLP